MTRADARRGRWRSGGRWTVLCLLLRVAGPVQAGSFRVPDYLAPGRAPPPPVRATASAGPTGGTTRVLTLDQALTLGLEKSRQVWILENELEAALQGYREVKARFLPRFRVLADSKETQEYEITQRLSAEGSLTLMHKVPGSGRKSLAANLSQALFVLSDPDLRQAGLGWALAQLAFLEGIEAYKFSVIQSFYEVVRNQELLKSKLESVDRTRTLVEIARAKFELGITSKLDLLNSQVVEGQARTAAIDQRARLQKSVDELRDLVGIVELAPLEVEEPLEFRELRMAVVDGFRRDLEQAKVRERVARSRSGEARQRSRPDLKVQMAYDPQAPEQIVAGLQYTFVAGKRPEDHRYRARLAEEVVAQTRHADLWYQVRREKRDIVRVLQARLESVRVAEENLRNARESYEFSRLAFERGMINNIDLRVAQDNLTLARDAWISILIDYRLAAYQYVRVFGGTL